MELTPGKNYYVRTVTDHWVGELVSVDGPYTVTLKKFAWIADSGRLHAFLRDGKADSMEVEVANLSFEETDDDPPECKMGMRVQFLAIIQWPHPLFTETV